MSECYKCGRVLPAGRVECDPPCFGNQPEERQSDEQVQKFLEMMERQRAAIDWDKVVTPEDMMLVIKTLFAEARIMRGSEPYEKLKRFLKTED